MPQAVAHFSQHELGGTILQVVADAADGIVDIIESEQKVIRRYAEHDAWPHRRVNLFVVHDLEPLVAQIQRVAEIPAVVAEDIDRRPMVNVYDAANLEECSIFANRRVIERDGLWDDALAISGLLAHEHGHPLAENGTVSAARRLSVAVEIDGGIHPLATAVSQATPQSAASPGTGAGQVLLGLLSKLTIRAPQEIFANEIAIRAGFGDALSHLDERILDTMRLGVMKRGTLIDIIDSEVAGGRLAPSHKNPLTLIADIETVLPFALETAPFLRAGERKREKRLDAALVDGVLSRLPPEVAILYRDLRDHYVTLGAGLDPEAVRLWCDAAMAPLFRQFEMRGLKVRAPLSLAAAAGEQIADGGPRTKALNNSGRHR